MIKQLWCVVIVAMLARVVSGDVLVLKDGTRLEGDVRKTDGGWEVVAADGKVTQVPAARVQSIVLGKPDAQGASGAPTTNPAGGTSSAALALASLRRSVEALSEISQIIDRYQRFIDNTKEPDVVAEARKDQEMWRQRLERGMVKHGGKWVTPGEAADMILRANETAEQARQLLRAGKQAEAEQAIAEALDQDPASAGALYLRGVMLYRADKLTDARKAFEAVAQQVDRDAPTLNNIAVIMWRQKQIGGALIYYDQAMQAAPVNKYILDNVADALGTLPERDRKGAAVPKVARRFTEQDTILQQQMAPQGWFRWGSTWVDQKTLEGLKKQETDARARMQALQQEFDQANARVARIDEEIRANERAMNDLRASTMVRGSDGKYQYFPLPPSYYEYQRKNQDLRNEQTSLRTRLDTLRIEAQQAQQSLPAPRFTGVQQLVGVEGMPKVIVPAGETADPTTSPGS